MRHPKNIDGAAMSVIGTAFLLLGGARDPWMRYTAFAILVTGVVLMAYWYRKAISQGKIEDAGGSAEEATAAMPDEKNKNAQQGAP